MLAGDEAFVLPKVVAGLAELDVEVALAISAADQAKLGTLPGNVRLATNVPLHLFMPTCDAIVNQGGTSSLLTAACHGLPQVLIPQTADNPFNAANFAAGGASVTLDPADAGPAEIAAAVTRVLTEESPRAAAGKLRAEIESAATPAEIVRTLEDLA